MASARSASLSRGLEAEPPAGSRGRAPGGVSGGEAPLKLKAFRLLNFPRNSKICHVFHILLFFVVLITCYLAFTTLLQNCYPSFINPYPGNEELK